MVLKLIVGNKGSGKTKALIGLVNAAAETSKGNVVCIEKSQKLTFDISHRVRLIDIDDYSISGFDAFYGFVAGLLAGNYDITDLFLDTTLSIGGRNFEEFEKFIEKLHSLTGPSGAVITATVSADASELPESVHQYFVNY